MVEMSDELLFDKRLIERHIRLGLITREQVEGRINSTEDLTDQADIIDLVELQDEQEQARTPSNSQAN